MLGIRLLRNWKRKEEGRKRGKIGREEEGAKGEDVWERSKSGVRDDDGSEECREMGRRMWGIRRT